MSKGLNSGQISKFQFESGPEIFFTLESTKFPSKIMKLKPNFQTFRNLWNSYSHGDHYETLYSTYTKCFIHRWRKVWKLGVNFKIFEWNFLKFGGQMPIFGPLQNLFFWNLPSFENFLTPFDTFWHSVRHLWLNESS